ncbi:precorrin-3B synthase [Aquipseudomonas alcaligenes]|uniref:Precorrin-3B synthase n=1 Tax=Aquipseudomonas alcaligenes TaxID=43263 RepID=A0AA37CE65_AQUAC|nr:precorrin-3B synthase [Pseudomonas alcaligenes]GIZ66740.1 precorrin-3B synthase [Pseudomonas alcaligenes]GIZ71576.1 precorrin-3B synthase [Pseudomonas alcaligenes]GIZ75925.1 precorrin-3B synthase [Pseudomonas alcaligenes]GIZ80352.1 precorrin-3B synthase [Pseudomonas alcaligenes]
MPARDGGICRVKLPGGLLTSAQARAVAEAARLYGSGVLELTNRSNLQLRGVREECQAPLVQHLLAAGLGPRNPAADDVRNLLLSPAAGRDRSAHLDTRPLAGRLLALLENTPEFHALSAKFALQLDGGEALAMLDHPHDLWLSALPGGTHLAFGLAGCPRDPALGAIPLVHAEILVEAVLRLFLQVVGTHTRMRQLLAELSVEQFLARLSLPVQQPRATPVRPRYDSPPLGAHVQAQSGWVMLLAGAPLGRLQAEQLIALAELADSEGSGELRLTPWQGVLLPDVPGSRRAVVAQALHDLSLLLEAREPLARLLACSGLPGCARAQADTKADARQLAERLPAQIVQVHLSGCPRSCAAAHVAPYTLLAQPGGRYDLYRREQGQAGFGRLLAQSLDIDQAGEHLAAGSPE